MRNKLLLTAILLGTILLRLPGLTEPIWGPRSSDSAAIARNFYQEEMNPFYPRIDWRGAGEGYVEEGFQGYTFMVALLYELWSHPSELIGKILNILLFTGSTLLIFLLALYLDTIRSALFTAFFFSMAPLGIYYGRVFIPDIFILFCLLLATWLFLRFSTLLPSAIVLAVAIACKPLTLFIGLPLLYFCHVIYGWRLFRLWWLWAYAGIAILPAIGWYWHAHSLWLDYGNSNLHFGWPIYASLDYWLNPELYYVIGKRIVWQLTTFAGLPLFLLGLLTYSSNRLAHMWMAGVGIMILLVPGLYLPHDYYLLPLLVPIAILMGRGADTICRLNLNTGAIAAALCFPVVLSSWYAGSVLHQLPANMPQRIAFGQRLQELTQPDDLLILAHDWQRPSLPVPLEDCRHLEPDIGCLGHDQEEFYQANRKGWSIFDSSWTMEVTQALQQRGAKYWATRKLATLKEKPEFLQSMLQSYVLVESTPDWIIFALQEEPYE